MNQHFRERIGYPPLLPPPILPPTPCPSPFSSLFFLDWFYLGTFATAIEARSIVRDRRQLKDVATRYRKDRSIVDHIRGVEGTKSHRC